MSVNFGNERIFCMKNMTLERITQVCGGVYYGSDADSKKEITGVVIDSRQVQAGNLFVAIKGEKADGHQFIPQVFEQGALVVLSEQELVNPAGAYIKVPSTLAAMKKIAADYRRQLDIRVVGITGSVGKTSTKEMIASVLSQKYRVLKTEGNFNNEIGLPLTIFKIKQEHQVAVLEMGISEFGEMHRLAEMAYPDICVITNIGLCHLENLLTRDGILKAKTESFEHLTPSGMAVLNGDDDKLCTQTNVNGKPPIFYGIGKEPKVIRTKQETIAPAEKTVYATEIETVGLDGMKAVIHTPEGQFTVTIPIAGEHQVYNALAAVCAARELNLSMDEMKRGIEAVCTIGGRSNLIQKGGITIIDDCYNANPVSMKASLDVLAGASGRKIAVLGDMGELGENESELHAMVGRHFQGKGIDALFAVGTRCKSLADAAKNCSETEVFYVPTKDELFKKLLPYVKRGDTILVKASHFMGFEEIVKQLAAFGE